MLQLCKAIAYRVGSHSIDANQRFPVRPLQAEFGYSQLARIHYSAAIHYIVTMMRHHSLKVLSWVAIIVSCNVYATDFSNYSGEQLWR